MKLQQLLQQEILEGVIFSRCLLSDLVGRTENTAAHFFGQKCYLN